MDDGIADKMRDIEKALGKEFPTKIIYESSPEKLVENVVAELRKIH